MGKSECQCQFVDLVLGDFECRDERCQAICCGCGCLVGCGDEWHIDRLRASSEWVERGQGDDVVERGSVKTLLSRVINSCQRLRTQQLVSSLYFHVKLIVCS